MKAFRLIVIVALAFMGLMSCQKAPSLVITSPASIDLSVNGSSGTITFTANRDWTISASDSWVSVSPRSGEASKAPVTVNVSCNANTTYDDRTATVTIKMEDQIQTVTIKQSANLGIVLATQAYELVSDARTLDITVQANVEYKVEITGDWIKQTGTKGLTPKTLTFSIEENQTYDSREGKITIKPQDGSVQEQVISVKQDGRIAVTSVVLDKTSATMKVGETVTLTATVKPGDATVTWSTSDASVATVNNGVVTAVMIGSATITAKAGDKTATCAITVVASGSHEGIIEEDW